MGMQVLRGIRRVSLSVLSGVACLMISAHAGEVSEMRSPFSMQLKAVSQSNLYATDHPDHQAQGDLWVVPSYRISDEFRVSALAIVSKEFTDERKTSLSNTKLSLRRGKMEINPYLSFSPGISTSLPTSEESVQRDSFRGSLIAEPRLHYDLSRTGLKLSGFHQVSLTRNFHEFETTTQGRSNSRYSVSYWAEASYPIIRGLEITLDFIRTKGFTYQGHPKDSFELSEELSYEINPQFSVAIGHTNEASTLKANGTDSNVGIFDASTSIIYSSLALTL